MNRVAVVGAGPVGATLALLLARDEVAVVLLDAKASWQPEGSKAMVVAGHTFETFARLGLPELGARAVLTSCLIAAFFRGSGLAWIVLEKGYPPRRNRSCAFC